MPSASHFSTAFGSSQEKRARPGDLLGDMDCAWTNGSLRTAFDAFVEQRLAEAETLLVLEKASRELRAQLDNGLNFLTPSTQTAAS